MIDASFIEKILEISETQYMTIGDKGYTTKQIFPVLEPVPAKLETTTLTSIVDYIYIKAQDDSPDSGFIIHIKSHNEVMLTGHLFGDFKQRPFYIGATYPAGYSRFGNFIPLDQFIIDLMTNFEDTEAKVALLRMFSSIKEEDSITHKDNSISQQITVKTGAIVEQTEIPNPVRLKPFRTFQEVDQPESLFIVRMIKRDGNVPMPAVGLFEADGGAWKLEAIANIKKWFLNNISGIPILA